MGCVPLQPVLGIISLPILEDGGRHEFKTINWPHELTAGRAAELVQQRTAASEKAIKDFEQLQRALRCRGEIRTRCF